jgi:signal transduction histidine kinase
MIPPWRTRSRRRPLRLRLTLVYTGLFLLAGAALLTITNGLVRSTGQSPVPSPSEVELDMASRLACTKALASGKATHNTLVKCTAIIRDAAVAGAARQRSLDVGHLLVYSVLALAVMALLSAAAGWLVAGRALRPVHAITGAARRASESNLSERLSMTGPADELKELADTFDAMLDRLDAAFRSQRRFVANASHELRTPLTLIKTAIDVTLAKPGRTPAQLEQMATDVRQAADHADALIDALLTLARSETAIGPAEPVDLAVVAEDSVEAAAAAAAAAGLRVRTDFDAARTAGDALLIERMVANLVDNAIRHNVADGWLAVSTGVRAGSAFVEVTNSGERVPADREQALFEPFSRLSDRTNGAGHGLGLSIARSVAKAHQGTVSACGRADGGLRVTVLMPAASPDA